jgi:large subunit ribosomal protein L19
MNRIEELEKEQMKKDLQQFNIGDTVVVSKIIREGKKERIQKFEGIVIKKQGRFARENFTVRKIIDGIGVEKTFLINSPLVPEIKVVKRGLVRRAKLFYLRSRIGAKATRVKTKE